MSKQEAKKLYCSYGDHGHVLVVEVWRTPWYEEEEERKITEEWFRLKSVDGDNAVEEVSCLLNSGRINSPEDPRDSFRNVRIICERSLKPSKKETHVGKSHE